MTRQQILLVLFPAVAALFLAACASSTKRAEPRGFLGDYSQLREGDKNEARYVYINESADFSRYTKVELLPVTVWRTQDSNLSELDQAEVQELVDHLFTAVHTALSADYEIVDQSGPDVMTIRIALTEAVGAKQALNTVSTVIPVGLVASSGKKLATGSHAFVGKAAVEMEILDSLSSRRLAAAVDERAGGKGIGAEWDQVNKAFDFWAEKLADRLQRLSEASSLKQKLIDVKM